MLGSYLLASAAFAALAATSPIPSNQTISAENVLYTCSSGGCLWSFTAEAPSQGTGFPAFSTTCGGTGYNLDYVPCDDITTTESSIAGQTVSAWIETQNNPDFDPYKGNTYIPPKVLHIEYEVSTAEGGRYNWIAEADFYAAAQPNTLPEVLVTVVNATAVL